LKHARDPRVELVGVCGTPRPLREFDKARELGGRYHASDTRRIGARPCHRTFISPALFNNR